MNRFAFTLPFGLVCGSIVGMLVGGMWVHWHLGHDVNAANPFILLSDYPGYRAALTDPWRKAYTVVLVFALAFALLALFVSLGHKLTQYGKAHFQSRTEMRRNGLLKPVGSGLVYGKLYRFGPVGRRLGSGRFISAVYDQFPHCLIVAPTRAGKGVGYVNPNVLLFPGSVVILDVKGEIFEATARHRVSLGDEVFRFAPFDFEHSSHRYNPLERVARIVNPDERYTELAKIADYFLLVSDKGSAGDFLSEGRELFVAAGLLAIERGAPTIGEISRILFGQGATQEVYAALADEVKHINASRTFRKFAGYSDRTLSSHASVLGGAGMTLWNNPAVDRATSGNDFSFADLRRKPMSVYLVVNSDSIQTLAPLIRLLFGELIATLRATMPDPEREPWPVKMILDEFDQLGRMTTVVQSLKQLAGHGARVSIITQSVPGLEQIYGKEDRLSIEAAAGMKLYLAANDKMTAAEISEALGKTTRLSVSDSYSPDRMGLLRRTISRRNEERPLLSPDEIRRLDRNKVILIPERQHPVMVNRIVYYEDPFFQKIMAAQTGPLPYPAKEQREIGVLRDQIEALTSQVTELSKVRFIDYDTGEAKVPAQPAKPAAASQKEAIADAVADLPPAQPEEVKPQPKVQTGEPIETNTVKGVSGSASTETQKEFGFDAADSGEQNDVDLGDFGFTAEAVRAQMSAFTDRYQSKIG